MSTHRTPPRAGRALAATALITATAPAHPTEGRIVQTGELADHYDFNDPVSGKRVAAWREPALIDDVLGGLRGRMDDIPLPSGDARSPERRTGRAKL